MDYGQSQPVAQGPNFENGQIFSTPEVESNPETSNLETYTPEHDTRNLGNTAISSPEMTLSERPEIREVTLGQAPSIEIETLTPAPEVEMVEWVENEDDYAVIKVDKKLDKRAVKKVEGEVARFPREIDASSFYDTIRRGKGMSTKLLKNSWNREIGDAK